MKRCRYRKYITCYILSVLLILNLLNPLSPLIFCLNYLYLSPNVHPFSTFSLSLKSSLIIPILTDLPPFFCIPHKRNTSVMISRYLIIHAMFISHFDWTFHSFPTGIQMLTIDWEIINNRWQILA